MATTTVTALEAAANYLRDNSPEYVSYTSALLRHVLDETPLPPPPPPPPPNSEPYTLSLELFNLARNRGRISLHNLLISDAIKHSIKDLEYYQQCSRESCVHGADHFSSGLGCYNLATSVEHGGLNFLFVMDLGGTDIKKIWDLYNLRLEHEYLSKRKSMSYCPLEPITEAMELRYRLFMHPRLPVEKRPWVFISLLTLHLQDRKSVV